LSTDLWPEGYGRRLLATVDSTNAEAARIAPGLAGPAWILAEAQTAGRGRRGRAWAMPPGNFAATLVMRPEGGPAEAALRSFTAALALYDAFVAVTGRTEPFALKWPNDVLLNGGKVAGILLESLGQAGRLEHLAIGIGVNLMAAPPPGAVEPGATPPVSLLGETGVRVSPAEFLTPLATAFSRWENQFQAYGFEPLRRAFLARAARLGQPIIARTASEEVAGTFDTIDPAGHLVLVTPAGRRTIPAADVFFNGA
jgi:BirA family biotin operon repressor/biotin-[acetyl-CoA-carboxylase] ligase